MDCIKRFIFKIMTVLFFISFLSGSLDIALAEDLIKDTDSKTLLIINSYHNGQIWEKNILEGVQEGIESYSTNKISIKVEYLDFRHNFGEEYLKEFIEMLEVKYPKGTIHGIYAVDDEAFIFIKDYILNSESEFFKVPLIFSGVNSKITLSSQEKEYITGIYERDDTVQLLNLITDMNEDIRSIDVIIEDSEYGDSLEREINEQIKEHWNGYIDVNYIKGNYIEDIEDQLSKTKFKENGSIIIAGEYQYKQSNAYVNPIETIKLIKRYSTNPIYSNDQTYIDAGILGGCIDLGEDHGRSIVDIFNYILNGEDISSIESNLEPAASKFINYKEIYEFDINPWDIPMYSIIRNKQFYNLLVPTSIKYLISFMILGLGLLIFKLIKSAALEKKKRLEQEALEKIKTDHIINMSHELRTPINIILNTVKLLEHKIREDEVDKQYLSMRLNNISKNSFRLLKVVNNIIDISKSRFGLLKLNLVNEDIVDLNRVIFEQIDDYCASKDISITFNSSEEKIIMAIDKEKIQRAILNILSNAIKFTDEGGSIDWFIEKVDNNVTITIKDTGIGIPKELIDNIFLKFYQVDDIMTRRSEGSGIGLYICNGIVKLHSGEISVQSKVGVGSTFVITLPITICKNEKSEYVFRDSSHSINVEMSDID